LKRFEDYKDAVIEAYQKKKREGSLPANLDRHTVASLKKECLNEFPVRYSNKDRETFNSLFGPAENSEEYFQKIKASDPDIFKPLNNFLRGNTDDTKDRNIHLLAWLIDFEPRPFKPVDAYLLGNNNDAPPKPVSGTPDPISDNPFTTSDYQKSDIDQLKNQTDTTTTNLPPKGITNDNQPVENSDDLEKKTIVSIENDDDNNNPGNKESWFPSKLLRERKAVLSGLLIISGLIIIYLIIKPRYMYWNGNEYKSISFYQNIPPPVVIVPMDSTRPFNLKKIINLKLITRSSIGKVHYSKLDNILKFYTTGGENPEDTTRRLLPMTEYIYKKYVLKNCR